MSRRLMLDTDIFSYVVNDRYAGLRERFMRDVETICISSVTYAEALYGARKKKSERIASLIGLFSDFIAILPWTEKEASAYADIRVALETAGTPIGSDDIFIAAVAKANDLTLVTNNTAHFSKVPGLKIENWISEGTELKGTSRK